MAGLKDFTTKEKLAEIWRALDVDEEKRADALIHAASTQLRLIAKNNKVDLDEIIEEDDSKVFADSVRFVVLAAVKRAMLTPVDAPPATQWSQAASPYSESMTFTNPASDLYFKKSELQMLGLNKISGKSQIGVLRGVR
jgi:hypothetical protein